MEASIFDIIYTISFVLAIIFIVHKLGKINTTLTNLSTKFPLLISNMKNDVERQGKKIDEHEKRIRHLEDIDTMQLYKKG